MGQPVKLSDELVDVRERLFRFPSGVSPARSNSGQVSENRSNRYFVAIELFRCK
jgi:hypothetical protein